MPPTSHIFKPMAANAGAKRVRIEHVCTSGSRMEPLPVLVDSQRRADRRAGRDTWVVLGSSTEVSLLASFLMWMNKSGEPGELRHDDDEGMWHVRSTMHMDELTPGTDCVMITTVEELNNLIILAEGRVPRQFSPRTTFLLNLGWGHLGLVAAMAYNRLVRLMFNAKDTSDHCICTISTARDGPFNSEWVGRRQMHKQIPNEKHEEIRWSSAGEIFKDMDELADSISEETLGRAIIFMDHDAAQQHLPKISPKFKERCCTFTQSDMPGDAKNMDPDCWKHAVISGQELTFLGFLPNLTHILICPLRDGWVWDEELSQVVLGLQMVMRSKAEVWSAMCWRRLERAPEVHFLGLEDDFEFSPDEPADLMAHTVYFDHLVLSFLSTWSGFSADRWPLRIGGNVYLIEERLRRLIHKGLVEDPSAETTDPHGQLLSRKVLQLTERGDIARALSDPHTIQIDSMHSACLLAQLVERSSTATSAMTDAVCSMAVVLNGFDGATYINKIMQPNDAYQSYLDGWRSVAFEHSYKGPILLAICVWHSLRTGTEMAMALKPHLQGGSLISPYIDKSCMTIGFMLAVEWEHTSKRLEEPLRRVGVEVEYGAQQHRLAPDEYLDVEEMLVTAFMDKLAFINMPVGDGPFGYLVATGAELGKPSDQQMRLIDMDKCWNAEKKDEQGGPHGIFCIFTYHVSYVNDMKHVHTPYDITYVSTAAVARALRKVNAPMDLESLLTKIRTWYKVNSLEHFR